MNYKEVYGVTEAFERAICEYTGAPFCVAVDSCSSGLLLALFYAGIKGVEVDVPSRTYMSVPNCVIFAGGKVKWIPSDKETLRGAYNLHPTNVWDSALRFTSNMYIPGSAMCLSFSGVYKHLKLGKGGAILTDNEDAYRWYKKARFSGRNEVSYHGDTFTQLGLNCYMLPEIAARGLLLMNQFYNLDGTKKDMPDVELPYPDLSRFEIYNTTL